MRNTLHSILQIISRNESLVSLKTKHSKIQDIISHIHNNIYNPDLISIKSIADNFQISENYLSEYFSKQMGIGLKKYILNHKVKLAETQLKYTDFTLSEISFNLGFTDSSHFDKTFLSYKRVTAGAFRTEHRSSS